MAKHRKHVEPRPGSRIIARGKQCAIIDKVGNVLSVHPNFELAAIELAALAAAESQRLDADPKVRHRRYLARLYREASTYGTDLEEMAHALPPKASILENTRVKYLTLELFANINFAADERLRAALAAQRVLRSAQRANARKGAQTVNTVMARYHALSAMPKHRRAAQIASETGLGVKYCRRIIKKELVGEVSITKKLVGKTELVNPQAVSKCAN